MQTSAPLCAHTPLRLTTMHRKKTLHSFRHGCASISAHALDALPRVMEEDELPCRQWATYDKAFACVSCFFFSGEESGAGAMEADGLTDEHTGVADRSRPAAPRLTRVDGAGQAALTARHGGVGIQRRRRRP
jgi:hypothetical protein